MKSNRYSCDLCSRVIEDDSKFAHGACLSDRRYTIGNFDFHMGCAVKLARLLEGGLLGVAELLVRDMHKGRMAKEKEKEVPSA